MKKAAPDRHNPSKALVYVAVVLAMLFWGMSFIWTTIVFRYYDPITTIFLRLVLSSALLVSFIYLSGRKLFIRKEDLGTFLLLSLLMPFLYFIGENFGLKYTTPAIVAVIVSTIPLFTPIAAFLAFRERLTLFNIVGLFVSFGGIMIMLLNPDLKMIISIRGALFLLLAVVSAVVYSVLIKKVTLKYSPLQVITVQNIIGIVYFLPLFLLFGLRGFLDVKITAELALSLLQLALFASSLAFIFFITGIKHIGVSKANVFSNLIPVFTAVFSLLLGFESFTPGKIAGMALIIIGVLMTQVKRRKFSNLA